MKRFKPTLEAMAAFTIFLILVPLFALAAPAILFVMFLIKTNLYDWWIKTTERVTGEKIN